MIFAHVLALFPSIQELLPTHLTLELFSTVRQDVRAQSVGSLELLRANVTLVAFGTLVLDQVLSKVMFQFKCFAALLTSEAHLRMNSNFVHV